MSAAPKLSYTPEEYLKLEREATEKSEYLNGEINAMAGGSPTHNAVAFNAATAIGPQLKGSPCRGYSSDMRIQVDETGLYTYSDGVFVCGEPRFGSEKKDNLLNPTLIVEVLSPTTEGYDRGEKSAHYRRLESLQAYVLIVQDRPHVECYTRQPGGQWLLTEATGLEQAIRLAPLGCDLRLAEVYEGVEFESEAVRLRPGGAIPKDEVAEG